MQEIERVALRHRLALALVGVLVLVLIALLPLAVVSAFWNVIGAAYNGGPLSPTDIPAAPTHTRLHLELITLDPWQQMASARVSGHHVCVPECTWADRVVFFALRPDNPTAESLPPS